MTRIRPTEKRMIADLLLEPAEDAEELAERIIRALDEKRQDDKQYVVIVVDPGVGTYVYGPFPGRKSALNAIGKRVVAASEGAKGGVFGVIQA